MSEHTRLKTAFNEYITEVYADYEGDVPDAQRRELEMAFFAGAYALHDELHKIRERGYKDGEAKSVEALTSELHTACLSFMKDVGE